MNLSTRIGGPPAENADGLLTDFFRSELPSRWPEAPLPVTPAERSHWLTAARTRLALAASIAVLVAGPLLLGTAFHNAPLERHEGSAAQPKLKTNLRFEQPPDGPTEIRIDIIEEPIRAR